MANDEKPPPKVFISYSWDSPEHVDRVLELSDRLRSDGIDCMLDQYEEGSPPEGWPRWMERQIREAYFVLMICTHTYYLRVMGDEKPDVGLGVRWEGNLIYQHIYDAQTRNTKFIPILFKETDISNIPDPIRGSSHYNLATEDGYEKLYRLLTNQPLTPKPQLGKLREMPPRERKADVSFPTQKPDLEIIPKPLPQRGEDTFVLSGQEEILNGERSTAGTSGIATRQQTSTYVSVNRHYEALREKEITVKEAYRFFSRTQVDIYADQCRQQINPVLKLNKPVHNLNNYLDKAHLPANMYQLRSQLKPVLNRIEVLLSDLERLKMNCCPEELKTPIKRRQNIQQNLKELVSSLNEVNSFMRSFNKQVSSVL